ncbi:MAG: hypothetical protein ACNA8H_10420 [Anaerolineales bacterium]
MGQKYRAQILLEPEQHQSLKNIAKKENKSLSEVAREVIRIGLDARENQADILWSKREEALNRLNKIREEVYQKYGTYKGDLIAEVRAERERQFNGLINEKDKE